MGEMNRASIPKECISNRSRLAVDWVLVMTSVLVSTIAGCTSRNSDPLARRPDGELPQLLSISMKGASSTGVRRWRIDETTPAPSPEWSAADDSRVPLIAVFRTSDEYAEVSVDCELEPQEGYLKAAFETSSNLSLQASKCVRLHPGIRLYDLPFPRAAFPSIGTADGVLVFSFGKESNGRFSEFARLPLRIYTILGTPCLPWVAAPDSDDNPHAPWIIALDIAVQWARGARTRHEAASLITHAVFGLGLEGETGRLKWVGSFPQFCTNYSLQPGRNAFSVDRFFLSDFLDALKVKGASPHPVNCHDVSAAVYTFANLVGCNLGLTTLEVDRGITNGANFNVRPVWPLGSRGIVEGLSFSSHQVNSLTTPDGRMLIYDACLAFSENGRPVPACGLPLGNGADNESYVGKLTPDASLLRLHKVEQRSIAPLRYQEVLPASSKRD